jgi:hypothetical protein
VKAHSGVEIADIYPVAFEYDGFYISTPDVATLIT